MKSRKSVAGTTLLIMLFFATTIGGNAAWAEIVVTDFSGRRIVLEKPAQRIVALAPHIVENMASAGGMTQLVGVVDYCDYPLEAKTKAHVGSISQYSIESIIALKPDLVLVWLSAKGSAAIDTFKKFGIATYASDPHSLDDVAKEIRDYGTLMGTSAFAETHAQAYEKKLRALRKQNQHKTPVSVLYQVWYEPLQTINDQHIISDVIKLCGGTNAFGTLPTLAPKLSTESVMVRDPEVIIASGMGEARPDWLDNWKAWPSLTAVKKQHLYFIPPDIIQRHTARILDGASLMCEHLDRAR